jgi:hypothetical protein
VGLKGFEPLTLRLSSACSNQLSYRPENFTLSILDSSSATSGPLLKSTIQNRKSKMAVGLRQDGVTFSLGENGGKGIRTPDFQLAKLALYQLSYAPAKQTDRL